MSGQGTSDPVGVDAEARRAAERLSRVPPLWSLAEKVAPAHTALVVVDVQNDFCSPAGMMSAEGLDVSAAVTTAERLERFIAAARSAGVLVVFVRSVLSSDDNHYLSDVILEQATRRRAGSYTLRPVCVAGAFGGDFYGNVRPAPGDPVVTKHRYSAFLRTDLGDHPAHRRYSHRRPGGGGHQRVRRDDRPRRLHAGFLRGALLGRHRGLQRKPSTRPPSPQSTATSARSPRSPR